MGDSQNLTRSKLVALSFPKHRLPPTDIPPMPDCMTRKKFGAEEATGVSSSRKAKSFISMTEMRSDLVIVPSISTLCFITLLLNIALEQSDISAEVQANRASKNQAHGHVPRPEASNKQFERSSREHRQARPSSNRRLMLTPTRSASKKKGVQQATSFLSLVQISQIYHTKAKLRHVITLISRLDQTLSPILSPQQRQTPRLETYPPSPNRTKLIFSLRAFRENKNQSLRVQEGLTWDPYSDLFQ